MQNLSPTELVSLIFQVAGTLLALALTVLVLRVMPRLNRLGEELSLALQKVQLALVHFESIARELRERKVVENAAATLDSTRAAMARIDPLTVELHGAVSRTRTLVEEVAERFGPLAGEVSQTLSETRWLLGDAAGKVDPLTTEMRATLASAKDLLEDATQTSQVVRLRAEELAATQTELTKLARGLAHVAVELEDRDLAGQLSNVIADTSLLAADVGLLAQNANSFIETGRPLIESVGHVVDGAKDKVHRLTDRIDSIREGVKAGVAVLKGQ